MGGWVGGSMDRIMLHLARTLPETLVIHPLNTFQSLNRHPENTIEKVPRQPQGTLKTLLKHHLNTFKTLSRHPEYILYTYVVKKDGLRVAGGWMGGWFHG